jgi:methylthioribulose-1-phosphate dehydratase
MPKERLLAPLSGRGQRFGRARRDLASECRTLAGRGLLPGTAGNLSVLVSREPFRVAVTPSGVDKGVVRPGQIVMVDKYGNPADGHGRPSYELPLHLSIFRRDERARAVVHTHSVWSVLASQRDAGATELRLADYEQLKGLEDVTTHEHEEVVPILDNDQDMGRMSAAVFDVVDPGATHAVLLRGHGLYTWGPSLAAARRHVETFEFLLEADVRRARVGEQLRGG